MVKESEKKSINSSDSKGNIISSKSKKKTDLSKSKKSIKLKEEISLKELDNKLDELSIDNGKSIKKNLNEYKKENIKNSFKNFGKIKKIIIICSIFLVILGIILYFTISNFSVIKNGFNSTTKTMVEIFSSNNINVSDSMKMYVSIKGAKINLLEEENDLKISLKNECSIEKKQLENSIRIEEKNICDVEKNKLTQQINDLQSKYNICKESLEEYEESNCTI